MAQSSFLSKSIPLILTKGDVVKKLHSVGLMTLLVIQILSVNLHNSMENIKHQKVSNCKVNPPSTPAPLFSTNQMSIQILPE